MAKQKTSAPEAKAKVAKGTGKKKAGMKKPAKKSPNSIEEKILALLRDQSKVIGLPTIKKVLIAEYGCKDSPAFRKNVGQTLKILESVERADFGKSGGSYHGGESSRTGKKALAAEKKQNRLLKQELGEGTVSKNRGQLSTLHLRDLGSGRRLTVTGLWRGCTGLDVKEKVQDQIGAPPNMLEIMNGLRKLKDRDEIPVENNATIFFRCVLASR